MEPPTIVLQNFVGVKTEIPSETSWTEERSFPDIADYSSQYCLTESMSVKCEAGAQDFHKTGIIKTEVASTPVTDYPVFEQDDMLWVKTEQAITTKQNDDNNSSVEYRLDLPDPNMGVIQNLPTQAGGLDETATGRPVSKSHDHMTSVDADTHGEESSLTESTVKEPRQAPREDTCKNQKVTKRKRKSQKVAMTKKAKRVKKQQELEGGNTSSPGSSQKSLTEEAASREPQRSASPTDGSVLNPEQQLNRDTSSTKSAKGPKVCAFCGKRFTCQSLLLRHLLTHSGEKTHLCSVCGKGFTSEKDVERHYVMHTGEKPFQCLVCVQRFAHLATRNRHMLTHTGEKPYACTTCPKKFTDPRNLRNHVLSHTGETPFTCEVCQRGFRRKDCLERHMSTHTGAKPYVCGVCQKCFAQQAILTKHFMVHTGEKPFSCGVCDKGFVDKHKLKDHMVTHTDQRPYRCPRCSITFRHHSNLKVHLARSCGQKVYKCDTCEKGYSRPQGLANHIHTRHGQGRT